MTAAQLRTLDWMLLLCERADKEEDGKISTATIRRFIAMVKAPAPQLEAA